MELERAISVALEGGVWPRDDLVALLMEAFGCSERTVQRAATELTRRGEMTAVTYTYWLACGMPNVISRYLGGFEREKLLAHLVAEPRDNPPDSPEEREDEIRDLMENR